MKKFKLIESEKHPRCYKTSMVGVVLHCLNEDDVIVIDEDTGDVIIPVFNDFWQYPSITKNNVTRTLHRVIAETFIPCPGDFDEMMVDHIDGIKLNYKISNLEWVTPSENALRAYKNGLRKDNRIIFVKDLRTDEIMEFYSLQACARHFNRNGQAIFTYVNGKRKIPFMRYYDLRYEHQRWSSLTKDDVDRVDAQFAREVVLELSNPTRYIIFPTLAEASKFTGNASSHISARLKTPLIDRKPMGEFKYFNRWELNEGIKNVEVRQKYSKPRIFPKRKPAPILVKNFKDGTDKRYDSVEAFGNAIGVIKNTIQKSMLINKGLFKHFHITYLHKSQSAPPETVE